jgi:hypothetical protein
VRWGYGSKLLNNSIYVRFYFGWRALTVTPAYRLRISLNEGRVSCGRDRGGGVTSLSSSSSSEDLGFEGSPPPAPLPPSGRHSRPAFSVSAPTIAHCGHGLLPASPHS